MEKTARPILVPFGVIPCGRDNYNSIPNNFFGSGELDIEAAINYCLDNGKDDVNNAKSGESETAHKKSVAEPVNECISESYIEFVSGGASGDAN